MTARHPDPLPTLAAICAEWSWPAPFVRRWHGKTEVVVSPRDGRRVTATAPTDREAAAGCLEVLRGRTGRRGRP